LVALSENIVKRCTSDGSLELGCATSTLLSHLLSQTFLVLASVQHSPVNLAWVALSHMGLRTLAVHEVVRLAICLYKLLSVARINF